MPYSGHKRAKNLTGKDLLVEFDLFILWASALTKFTMAATSAMADEEIHGPTDLHGQLLGRKKDLLNLPAH